MNDLKRIALDESQYAYPSTTNAFCPNAAKASLGEE